MRVFMLGWEFPPFISGGLGTACFGLTKAMNARGLDVLFVLPKPVTTPFSTHVTMVSTPRFTSADALAQIPGGVPGNAQQPGIEMSLPGFENVSFRSIETNITDPYARPGDVTPVTYQQPGEPGQNLPPGVNPLATQQSLANQAGASLGATQTVGGEAPRLGQVGRAGQPVQLPANQPAAPAPNEHYGQDLFSEVHRYAALAAEIARGEEFDVIHAHDWMTYPAGLAVAAVSGKPLVVHVHSTEFDRAGENVDQRIYDVERRGMHEAARVVCVSHLTQSICQRRYGVPENKLRVVYNAINLNSSGYDPEAASIKKDEKIVLYLGRITYQKGPEYFLAAAKKVLDVVQDVKFVVAGSGDMVRRMITQAAEMGIGHKVLFTGFLRGPDVDRVFRMADLYVMPSVSEPFGIAPLEAMGNDVPVLISKQSGVSEVIKHALKVDFWNTTEMADKIVAVLRHPPLASTLKQHGAMEVRKLDWATAAQQCEEIYAEVAEPDRAAK
ncbi:MAG: glycosyltransferase [Phycisphaerae bacterium]